MYRNELVGNLMESGFEFSQQENELYSNIDNNNNLWNFTTVTIDSYYQNQDNIIFVVSELKYTDIKYSIKNDEIVTSDLLLLFQEEITNTIQDSENIGIFENYNNAYDYATLILKGKSFHDTLLKVGYNVI